jgi:hypothetical protein
VSAAADLFIGIKTLTVGVANPWVPGTGGDSTSGGLNEVTSAAHLRGYVFRKDDPDHRSQNWPRLIVEILEDEDDKFNGTDTVSMLVKFYIYTSMEKPTFTAQNAVLARMRAVIHRATPAATSAWTFTDILFKSGYQGQPTQSELVYVLPARVYAREV